MSKGEVRGAYRMWKRGNGERGEKSHPRARTTAMSMQEIDQRKARGTGPKPT